MRTTLLACLLATFVAALPLAAPQGTTVMPLDEIRPGMVGVGREAGAQERERCALAGCAPP